MTRSRSRSEAWDWVRALEDLQAVLVRIDDRRKVIRLQAYHEGSFDAIYDEAVGLERDLANARGRIGVLWAEAIEAARQEDADEADIGVGCGDRREA